MSGDMTAEMRTIRSLENKVARLEAELASVHKHSLGMQAMPDGKTWLTCRTCNHIEEVY